MDLLTKILSKLRDENKHIELKIQPQENDYVTIAFFISREQRINIIDSIENTAELPIELLYAFAEAIRNAKLNRDSWAEEDRKYWEEVYRRMEP